MAVYTVAIAAGITLALWAAAEAAIEALRELRMHAQRRAAVQGLRDLHAQRREERQ